MQLKNLISKIAIAPKILKTEIGLLFNMLISRIAVFFYNNLTVLLPINNANVINISKPELPQQKDKETTLSLKWFGSGNYEIRLGAFIQTRY